jgi:hypothetical protein
MMNRLLKMTWIAACFFLTFTHLQAGNCETSQKVLTKSFPVSDNATLKIENIFGKIVISEWDKNEISFTVTIKTTAKKQSAAQDLVDKVVVDFKQEGNTVSAKTTCPSQKDKCNCTYKIDYQISVPKNIHYDLQNKYGNIVMGNAAGNATVSLMYGDFSGNEFSGNSKINVSYGKLSLKKLSGTDDEVTLTGACEKKMSISEAKNLKINVKNSSLSIGTVEHLSIESAHTDVQILKAEKIQLNKSFYGKYEIGEVKELLSNNSNSWYAKFEINRLTGTLSFSDLTYCNIVIHNVMPSFESITFDDVRRTPIKMTLDASVVSCQLETYVKGGVLQVNAPKTDIPAFTSKDPVLVSGTFGDKGSPKSFIKIKTEDCKININQL